MYQRVTRGQWDPAKHDEFRRLVPELDAAIRQLPGCQDLRNGVERSTGRTMTVVTFDTQEHAQFPRERLGEPMTRLQAAGWQGEAPEI